MDLGSELLSSITVFSKYAKYLPDLKRRENWYEIVMRYKDMMVKQYPHLIKDIAENIRFILEKKVLPSMRALQFAGPAIDRSPSRIYNCCYFPIDSLHSFSEGMFLLLGGTGIGYSVQFHHVDKLPEIQKSTKSRRYLVGDSIEGWSDAIKAIMKAYFGLGPMPLFDLRDIRPKGARLVTAGGKAPGPEPLKVCLFQVQKILDRKENGSKLSPLECHDIMCHIANAVLSGGIRRAAMIALFSFDDEEMLTCKYGKWYELNEQRGRANNSAVGIRSRITEEGFMDLWRKIELSGSGEPGLYLSNNSDWGTNPCCEIGLRPYQFCNLCEINVSDIIDETDLIDRVGATAFFGTLQAGFTDFHYLRPIWRRTTEKDALLGIGMTGIASGEILKYDLQKMALVAKKMNAFVSKAIGINEAARVTCVKPSGTTSCVLGTSSGIHAWHDKYYLRTVRFNKNEDIALHLMIHHPELVEDDALRPHDTICVRIPIKAPEGAILRDETAINLLERVKKFSTEWVKAGHRYGDNTHNVSATISIDANRNYTFCHGGDENGIPDKMGYHGEWETVGYWMWKNRDMYNGLSVIPFDGGSYVQSPFESITKEEYEERVKHIHSIDLTKVIEMDDTTDLKGEAACSAGGCAV